MGRDNWICPCCGRRNQFDWELCLNYDNEKINFYVCRCGLGFSDFVFKGKIPDIYNESFYSQIRYSDQLGRESYIKHVWAFLEKYLRFDSFNSFDLLDVGCATGDFVNHAIERRINAVGVDRSVDAVRIGKSKSLPLYHLSIYELGQLNTQFDVITLWDVLEHLPDMELALKSTVNVLKPGGKIFIKTVLRQSLIEKIGYVLYWISFRKFDFILKRIFVPGHLYYFTFSSLSSFLKKMNLEIIGYEKTDTPENSLFKSKIFKAVYSIIRKFQKRTGLCYEIIIVCQPC